ncbi:alanine/glycine:cation symporter family protein [Kordiimonas marina]|uniref:alanine/glycine:cation symporter family protein n=1 Tax=Kordiimonas marina TaxID=2872312 RepID=UPI001FF159CB|nr:alanine/glycine:cation symporter family protein [Kordiimonas marina]MCJ9430296.1 alanine:cation symporter family protein [Kordiimonas marina]
MIRRIMSFVAAAVLLSQTASASDGAKQSIENAVNSVVAPITDAISKVLFYPIPLDWLVKGAPGIPVIVLWLFSGAMFFTVYMRFINLRGFGQAIRIVSGKYDNPEDPGEVTHFQALTAALSATVGLGNIAGVALAIGIGGPGATFWMVMTGLLGMTSKFSEVTLGHKYRDINEQGVVSGGPMKYLSKGFAARGWPNFGKVLSIIFALICIGGAFGAGNMFQVNQSTAQLTAIAVELTGGPTSFFVGKAWIFGIIYSGLLSLVVIGGIRGITHVTEILVPFMAAIYVIAALAIIFANIGHVPAAFGEIIHGAFTGEGVTGGFVGVLIMGIRRAAFSNEAGLGTASIAHAAAKTKEPVAEGLVALIEPFVDTVVICTMTALVIILTGANNANTGDGIAMTSYAFDTFFNGFRYVLTVAVPLFAFSTTITYYYYGERALDYLTGGNAKHSATIYKACYLLAVILGSMMQLTAVMDFADAALLALGFPNLIGVFVMRKEVKGMLDSYLARLKSGEIKPFHGG